MTVTRTRALFLTVALLVSFALAVGPGAGVAQACSCAVLQTEEDKVQDSAAVFSGTVTSIDESQLSPNEGPPLGKVVFRVQDGIKGVSTDSVEVYGYGYEASCGIQFEKGESYLVYAYRAEEDAKGPLATNICQATKPLADADADIRYFKAEGLITPETGGPIIPPILLLAGAGFALAGAYLGWRTSRE